MRHSRLGWHRLVHLLVALLLALALLPGAPARAASLVVMNCTGGSLASAISTANNNGDASNTITFAVDCPTSNPITLSSTQTISKNLTLDGTGHTVVISGGNAVGLFRVSSSGVSFTVNALTLTRGNVANGLGGGINNGGGTVTVTNSTLSGNSAATNGSGGGIYNGGGTVTVTNSTLSGNSATDPNNGGGGIYNYPGGRVTVTNSTLSSNSATNGGGIVNAGTMTVTNSTLSGNSAGTQAGGIFNIGLLTVTNSTLSGNQGNGIYMGGAA